MEQIMVPRGFAFRQRHWRLVLLGALTTALLAVSPSIRAQQKRIDVLRIGTSGTLGTEKNEDAALETLKAFIKEETGFDSEIVRQKDWRELADKMSKGELHLGV